MLTAACIANQLQVKLSQISKVFISDILRKIFPTVVFAIQVYSMRLIVLRISPGLTETTRHFSTLRWRPPIRDRGTETHGRSQFRESIMGGAGSPGSPFFQGRPLPVVHFDLKLELKQNLDKSGDEIHDSLGSIFG